MIIVRQPERDAPLLREVYARWPPDFRPTDLAPGSTPQPPAPARPSSVAVYMLDETMVALGPLSGVGTGMRIVTQRDVAFGVATGTLYYVVPTAWTPQPSPTPIWPVPTPSAIPEDAYSWIVLVWRVGPVTLRMVAATDDLAYAFHVSDDPASVGVEIIAQTPRPFPPESAESDLLQTAASVQPYTGCGP